MSLLIGVVCALAAWATPGTGAHAAPERVTVPFACQLGQNRAISLTPTPPRAYDIVGSHEVRHMAICNPSARAPGSVGCKTLNLHRFEIMCGLKRVPWSDVATAIATLEKQSQSSIVRVEPAALTRHAQPDCRLSARNPTGRTFVVCRWPDWRPISLAAELPQGFAPVAEVGGKLQTAAQAIAAKSSERGARRPEPLVTTQPLPDITPAILEGFAPEARAVVLREPGSAASRSAAIGAASTGAATSGLSAPASLFATLMALLTSAAAAAGAAWRWPEHAQRAKALAARAGLQTIEHAESWAAVIGSAAARVIGKLRPGPVTPPMRDVKAANAVSAVAALLTDTSTRLVELKGAGPLSDVLQQEMTGLRQRLATLELAAGESEEAAGRASPGFRNLMRDIERVRRIADSAALSMGGGRNATRVPKTRSEAFDLLGLNPDAPDGTLKKVADGLRMSWHPDHARDDADRAEREARIKAINIAIDLINGKRAVA